MGRVSQEELGFFNQQLAGMLRSGIPIEAAFRQLSSSMKRGKLRSEIVRLEQALAKGESLSQALDGANLPPLYKQLLRVGAKSEDLPAMLVVIADFYTRGYILWTRLKGLLVYPFIVLICALLLSVLLAGSIFFATSELGFLGSVFSAANPPAPAGNPRLRAALFLGFPVLFLLTVLIGGTLLLLIRPTRDFLRWRFPGFKEAYISRLASSLAMLLRNQVPLPEALGVVRALETNRSVANDLESWQRRLEQGAVSMGDLAEKFRAIPPLFVWVLANSSENIQVGFERAADLYHNRATHRSEIMLYAALPIVTLFVGSVLLIQAIGLFRLIGVGFDVLAP